MTYDLDIASLKARQLVRLSFISFECSLFSPDSRAATLTPRATNSKGSRPAATSSAEGNEEAVALGEPLSSRSTSWPARDLRMLSEWPGGQEGTKHAMAQRDATALISTDRSTL
jgi:hypothetical protein